MLTNLLNDIRNVAHGVGRDNANTGNSAASKMYKVAEIAEKYIVLNETLPKSHAELHTGGYIYINDLSYYRHTFNCFYNPLGKMLANGFDNGIGGIRAPKRIGSAAQLTAICLQSSQNDLFKPKGN